MAQKASVSLLAEFKHNLGILPSLGSYSRLLAIFSGGYVGGGTGRSSSGQRREQPLVLLDILGELERRPLEDIRPRIEEDFEFFASAMDACLALNNLGLAYRLHDLAMRISHQGGLGNDDDNGGEGPGVAILGDFQRSNLYYHRLMLLVTRREPPDAAMELYGKLVPHVWTPTLAFYSGLLRELSAASASGGGAGWRHLPKVWTDLQSNNFCSVNLLGRMEFVSGFVKQLLLATTSLSSSAPADDEEEAGILRVAFVRIANDIFRDVETSRHSKRHPLSLNIHAMAICQSLLELALIMPATSDQPAALDLSLAKAVVRFCKENVAVLAGSLTGEVMTKFLDVVVSSQGGGGDKEPAFDSVIYAAENSLPEALEMGHRLVAAFGDQLDKVERNQLNLLFSHETRWVPLQ